MAIRFVISVKIIIELIHFFTQMLTLNIIDNIDGVLIAKLELIKLLLFSEVSVDDIVSIHLFDRLTIDF